MGTEDERWQQRLSNFKKTLSQLSEAIELMNKRPLSRLEKQGVVHGFECTYQLAWNTLEEFLIWQGLEGIVGPRDTIREGFNKGLISDGHGWMNMLTDRNRTSHTYYEETAEAILANIKTRHHSLLSELENALSARAKHSA